MRSRCPPGVICIENLTIFYIILCVGLVALYFYMNRQTSPNIIIQKEYINSGSKNEFDPNVPPMK